MVQNFSGFDYPHTKHSELVILIYAAIRREKQIKGWVRVKKMDL